MRTFTFKSSKDSSSQGGNGLPLGSKDSSEGGIEANIEATAARGRKEDAGQFNEIITGPEVVNTALTSLPPLKIGNKKERHNMRVNSTNMKR